MAEMMKAALIGVGGHGQAHLRTISQMEKEGLMRLVAVADPFRENQLDVAEQLALRGVSWFHSDEAMLSSTKELEVIIISTPIHLHEPMLLRALQYPRARILLEKPVTATYRQLETLIAADTDNRVRVGFQTLFLPQVQILKEKLISGELGNVTEVRAVGAWPRDTAYYQRAGWSGQMALGGQPVFDGPASNAMNHLLQNICYLLGEGRHEFGVPTEVSGILRRARTDIESYDTARIEAFFQGVPVHILLTHASSVRVPFEIHLLCTKGSACLLQNPPYLEMSTSQLPILEKPELIKYPLYRSLVSDDQSFALMPSRLSDAIGTLLLSQGALCSSGGCHEMPASEVVMLPQGVAEIKDIRGYMKRFLENPADTTFPEWLRCGPSVQKGAITSLADSVFIDK